MLERPLPRSAQIGIGGLLSIMLMTVVLLPTACKRANAPAVSQQPAIAVTNQMTNTELKHYENSEWRFAIDIPKSWNAFPPVSSNSPYEVIRFQSREDGFHGLIVFRNPIDPKQSLTEWSKGVQQVLARGDALGSFGNFVSGNTTIGSRAVLTLDFDKPGPPGKTWSCRYYFIADGTLGYILGFGTSNRAQMIDLYDRMAKTFQIFE